MITRQSRTSTLPATRAVFGERITTMPTSTCHQGIVMAYGVIAALAAGVLIVIAAVLIRRWRRRQRTAALVAASSSGAGGAVAMEDVDVGSSAEPSQVLRAEGHAQTTAYVPMQAADDAL